jgi:hypothetical protein
MRQSYLGKSIRQADFFLENYSASRMLSPYAGAQVASYSLTVRPETK